MKKFLSLILAVGVWTAADCVYSLQAESLASEQNLSDLVIADFEGDTYGDWKVTGKAFGAGPARGTLPNQMQVDGFLGRGLVNTYCEGDPSTGSLLSPEFKIQRPYIAFLIGGGKDAEKLCIRLRVDGKILRTATGPNDRPGGSERLGQAYWDVQELIGKTGSIEIIDQAVGGWGHLNIDQIIQTAQKPPLLLEKVQRQFKVENRYLNIPIRNGAPKRIVKLSVEGVEVVKNEIELADGLPASQPDWFAPMDLSPWLGKVVTLEVNQLLENSRALSSIKQTSSPLGQETLYREPLRGQLHFSPQRGWNNDPNGLSFYNGEYHLFFQHNPYGWAWGNMHWGHAVSPDMLHWKEVGDVLWPDSFGPMFSGSAVVDWKNTSALGSPDHPAHVLIYTAAGDPTVQCLAYSTDGRTYTKYEGNPILKQITPGNRDPKIFWHEPSGRWVMVLYVELEGVHTIHFFTSANLKEWALASIEKGDPVGKGSYLYECPDFFELPVDGDTANRKWVLMAANGEYSLGSFDGTNFHAQIVKQRNMFGRGFYAPQTFSDIPSGDGRRIQVGWFQTSTPAMPFNQSMTIPLELKIVSSPQGPRLSYAPVKEMESLRDCSWSWSRQNSLADLSEMNRLLGETRSELLEIHTQWAPSKERVEFSVRGIKFSYDPAKAELSLQDLHVPIPLSSNGILELNLYCDRTGFEIFADKGRVYIPLPLNLSSEDYSFSPSTEEDARKLVSLELHTLKSIWP